MDRPIRLRRCWRGTGKHLAPGCTAGPESLERVPESLTRVTELERETLRTERGSLLAPLKSTQAMLEEQNVRVSALEGSTTKELSAPARGSRGSRLAKGKVPGRRPRPPLTASARTCKGSSARKPKWRGPGKNQSTCRPGRRYALSAGRATASCTWSRICGVRGF